MTFLYTKAKNLPIILWTGLVLAGAVVFATFNSCNSPQSQTPVSKSSRTKVNYKAAYFEDTARIEKLKDAYPVADSMLRKFVAENHIPGLAYGIVVDGKLVHTANFGYSDISKKIAVTSSTMFRVASISKSVTAMAILKLRDEGKLSLDDPAAKYVVELAGQRYPTTDAPEITIRHLLTHGAGFPVDNPWGDRQLADSDKDLSELLKKKVSFSNAPGIAYEYSNLGFALLGKIVSVVSGKP